MRHLGWLSGLLLVISCSVDPVQNPDGGGTGAGGAPGGGGQAGTTTGTGGQGATTGTGGGAGDRPIGGSGGGQAGAGGGAAGHAGGGQGGHLTDGGETCAELETDYSAALATAIQCNPGSPNQCQYLVERSIACPGCQEFVNDLTTLNTIVSEWNSQDCGATPHPCPLSVCLQPATGTCASTSTTSGGPNAGASPGGTCVGSNVANRN